MEKFINFKTTYFFSTMGRYLGHIITLIGIIGLFTKGIETVVFCVVGLGLSFTRFGVLIDKENNKLKEYTSVFWIKLGGWKTLNHYPYITVLEITEKQTMYSNSNVAHSNKNLVFRITLLNENHYSKIVLKQLKDKELAHKEAENIAKVINVEKVIYSPG